MNHFRSIFAVLIIATLMLTACGTPATPAPGATEIPDQSGITPDATVPTLAEEKILTIISPTVNSDLSPLRGGGTAVRFQSLWWAPTIQGDRAGNFFPAVFASWSSSPDFKVWTFVIDPTAVFSDGSPITAEDVKGTWELITQPLTKHQRVSLFLSGIVGYEDAVAGNTTTLPGIVVIDEKTLEVTLKTPDPVFFKRIATNLIGPVKISQARGADGQEIAGWWDAKNNPAVSGPYMPVAMDLNAGSSEYIPNPNWWWGSEPKLDRIKIIAVEDGATALLMVQNGQADVNFSNDLPTTFDEVGVDYVGTNQNPDFVIQVFWINPLIAPMDDINCRKALIMAANPVDMFAASHPHGPGAAGTTLLTPILGDKETNQPLTNNPEGALAAFALCSYKDAMPKIFIGGTSNAQAEIAAQILVEEWRQVLGIQETELVPAMDSLSVADQAKVQFFRDDTGARFSDAATMLLNSVHSGSGAAQSKMGHYKNPQVDTLIEAALILAPTDPNRDLKALEAEKTVMEDYVYFPWVAEGPMMHQMPWVLNWLKNYDWQVIDPWNVDIDLSLRP